MKKYFCLVMTICILISCFTACSNEQISLKNKIAPMAQSQGQNEIVDLLNTGEQEILLFEYKTKDAYKDVEFWVEVYKDGELIDRPAEISYSNDVGKPLDGKAAITIFQNPDYQWTFIASENGGKYSSTGGSSVINEDTLASGSFSIDSSVEIEDGEEIVLYASMFSDGELPISGNEQEYAWNSETIKEYLYMHIIKCKFTV